MRPRRWGLTAAILFCATPAAAADFHVAVGGSDSNPGTEGAPFASLERARDAVRALKSTGGLPIGGVTVWVHSGRHFRTATFAEKEKGVSHKISILRSELDRRLQVLNFFDNRSFSS